jgi:FlaA1/EpsC-like NDP-sugar epimerase
MSITVTDRSVKRYFMHQDEAAFLTIKSFFLSGGDVHVFEMGEPVLIVDVVDRLQYLLGGSSNLVFTGLRPGEKLNEDLFGNLDEKIAEIQGSISSGSNLRSMSNHNEIISEIMERNDSAFYKYLEK